MGHLSAERQRGQDVAIADFIVGAEIINLASNSRSQCICGIADVKSETSMVQNDRSFLRNQEIISTRPRKMSWKCSSTRKPTENIA
jgi:exo-beta-1,3-glucanase (GH17 family)